MPLQPIKKSPHYVEKASHKVTSSECPCSPFKNRLAVTRVTRYLRYHRSQNGRKSSSKVHALRGCLCSIQ